MGFWSRLLGSPPPGRELPALEERTAKADGLDDLRRCEDPGHVELYERAPFGREFVEALYEQNKLAARIVDMLPEDMTKLPLAIDAGIFDGKAISDHIDSYHGRMLACTAQIYSRLYGGAGLLAFVEDGRHSSEPVDFHNVTRVAGFVAMHRYELRVVEWDRRADSRIAGMPNFGQPLMFRAQPIDGSTSATFQGSSVAGLWHRTRVIPWTNIPTLPRHRRYRYDGWSPGELERIIGALLARSEGMSHIGNLLRSFGFDVAKIVGLRQQLSTAAGQAEVQKRLRQLSKSLQITSGGVRVVGIDAGEAQGRPSEELTPMTRQVSGVRDLSDAEADYLQEISDYPRSKLYGRINAGMGNGEALGEEQAYYSLVSAKQPRIYVPQMRQMGELLCAAKDGPTGGIIPSRMVITCPSLWTMPEDMASKIRLENAQARDLERKLVTVGEARTDATLAARFKLEPPDEVNLDALDPPTPAELEFAVAVQAADAAPNVARALLRQVPRLADGADEIIPDMTADAELLPGAPTGAPPKLPVDLMKEPDVKRLLHIGPGALAKWVREGKLKPWPVGNGRRRYRESDLVALLEAERAPTVDASDWPAEGLSWRMLRGRDETGVSGTGEVVRGLVMADGSVISWWVVDGMPPRPHVDGSWSDFFLVHIEQHPANETTVEQRRGDAWVPVNLAIGPTL